MIAMAIWESPNLRRNSDSSFGIGDVGYSEALEIAAWTLSIVLGVVCFVFKGSA